MPPMIAIAAPAEHRLPGTPGEGAAWRPSLMLREQPPKSGDRSRPVLYVHGSTFPSALSIMFQLEGRSWADSLNDAGYDVFGLDFAGYGGSQRYEGPSAAPPRGRAIETADQVERAVRFILRETGAKRVSIVAHSWGTMPAGRFAGDHPELVDKLVFFGPVAQRQGSTQGEAVAPYLDVTIEAQHTRFVGSVPTGQPPVLIEGDFPRWASAYLDSDATSRTRTPASVRVPSGPEMDVADAWSGHLAYDPSRIHAPTLIVRGAWDPITQDADAAWLQGALSHSPFVQDVVVPRATHLMHLERGRSELYAATEAFLASAIATPATPNASARAPEKSMFAVVFEVSPDRRRFNDYLKIAGDLRPILETTPGFIENERFRSRSREGVLLSLSLWDDEKALVRWRATEKHHEGQREGRAGVLAAYHLRVGEVTQALGRHANRRLGWMNQAQTEVGTAKALTLVDSLSGSAEPDMKHCEVFDHLSQSGRTATLCEWETLEAAEAHANSFRVGPRSDTSVYAIRVIRDYGLNDRREAPQFMK